MQIGFIGLGNMGAPMAANLAKAGYQVVGFDTAEVAVPGVTAAQSAVEACQGKDVVITMLPNGDILRKVYEDVVAESPKGALFIDCSTVDVSSARAAHQLASEHHHLSVDAPVSGGIAGASAGTLTFMVGGTEDACTAAKPLLDVMGAKQVHCGDAGAGQAAKICNNMILGISMLGVCEAFALGNKLGLDLEKLYDVVSTASGSCWSVNTYCPVPGVGPTSPADNHYAPGFAASLMLKDLTLSQQAAESVGADTPMGARAKELYDAFVQADEKGLDFSALFPKLLGE